MTEAKSEESIRSQNTKPAEVSLSGVTPSSADAAVPIVPLPPPPEESSAQPEPSPKEERKDSSNVNSVPETKVPESDVSSSLPIAMETTAPAEQTSLPSPAAAETTAVMVPTPPKSSPQSNQEIEVSPLEMEIIDAIEKQAAKDAAEASKQQKERSKYATDKAPLITEIKRYYPVIVEVKPKKEKEKKKKKPKDKKVHPDAAAVEEIHTKAKAKWKKVGEHLHDIETGHTTDTDDEMPTTTRKNRNTIMQLNASEGGSALNKLRSPQQIARRPSALEQATINLLFRKVPRSIDKLSKYLPTYNDDILESISEIIFKPYPFTLKMFAYVLLILQFLSLVALVMSLAECPEEKIGWSIMAGIPLCCGYGKIRTILTCFTLLAGIESVHQMLRYCHLGSPHRWKVALIVINGVLQMIAVGAVMGKSTNMLDLISNFIGKLCHVSEEVTCAGVAIVLQIDELLAGYLRIKDIDPKMLSDKSWRSKMLLSSKLWLVLICGISVYGVTQFFWQYDKKYCSSQYADNAE